jgi:hypothetical protein
VFLRDKIRNAWVGIGRLVFDAPDTIKRRPNPVETPGEEKMLQRKELVFF